MNEFHPFPKIPRFESDMTITEKIDGTNAAIVFEDDGYGGVGAFYAQSRNRIITPDDDNFGFATWVDDNVAELSRLGPGVHFGEWWGHGIQRGYGIPDKRFSLFNVHRWRDDDARPACCHVVPVLYEGPFHPFTVGLVSYDLLQDGSHAAPGFDNPEGIMIWHARARQYFKWPYDAAPKGNNQ